MIFNVSLSSDSIKLVLIELIMIKTKDAYSKFFCCDGLAFLTLLIKFVNTIMLLFTHKEQPFTLKILNRHPNPPDFAIPNNKFKNKCDTRIKLTK